MVTRKRPDTFWMTPAPMWAGGLATCSVAGQARSDAPMILRFVTDSFMEEFNQLLESEPSRLSEYKVQPETWRGFSRPDMPEKEPEPMTLPLRRFGIQTPVKGQKRRVAVPPPLSTSPLKLYQPAHQRFYLVTSSLICDTDQLPDRSIDPGKQERVGFVVRRLWPGVKTSPEENLGFPDSTWKEYAFCGQSDGSFAWNPVQDRESRQIRSNEELLPMFPVSYGSKCKVHGRRLLAGLVPVGRREAYMGALAVSAPTTVSSTVTALTARKVLFRTLVSEPWKALVDIAVDFDEMRTEPPSFDSGDMPSDALDERLKQSRESIQTTSWLMMADLRQFLQDYNRTVWDRVAMKNPGDLTGAKKTLYDALHSVKLNSQLAKLLIQSMGSGSPKQTVDTLADALRLMEPSVVLRMESGYENFVIGEHNESSPPFLFPLVEPGNLVLSPQPVVSASIKPDEDSNDDFEIRSFSRSGAAQAGDVLKKKIDQFAAVVLRALDDSPVAGEPAVPLAAMQPADLREGWFLIRCVYRRPLCPVHTEPDIVSLPTAPFQMAGFFDPDAPARPIRIGLPVDTTPAGLRKFNKNTAFVISDVLCGQIKRMKGITFGRMVRSVLPWPFHKNLPKGGGGPCSRGGLNMGTICSLSIPIITLCALILLMVMVTLFDYLFRWLPFFILCFPIRGQRAKK